MKIRKKIAVIGAGMGGLSSAIRLSRSGFQVEVYEQNSIPGGKAGILKCDNFRFDTGPSILTMPFVLIELFSECGEEINEYINIEPHNVICKYFYGDGTVVNAYSDLSKFSKEIEAKTSDNSVALDTYFNYCKAIYDLTSELFLFNSLKPFYKLVNPNSFKALFNLNKIDVFKTMHQANSNFFSDKKMIQLFDRYATYTGSDPYSAPATLNIIPYVEYILGTYIVKQGIHSIAVALKSLAEKNGVEFYFKTKVDKILTEGNKVTGIQAGGKIRKYDAVLSNVDFYNTGKNLMDNYIPENKINQNLSSSCIVFYWGIKGIHKQLEIHNILFSEDYGKEFEDIFTKKKCPEDPTVYIYISSKFKSDDAPEGYENWFVMVNVPFNQGQNWISEAEKIKRNIINKISDLLGIEIQNKIVFEKIMTPVDLEKQTGSFKGSIYGVSSNNRLSAFLRPSNKSSEYNNLFFCGGSVHPGGGIPLAVLSGKIVSQLIKKDFE